MQVFCLTVIFGLFHGLVLLPVLLSMLGPSASQDTGSIATQSCSVSSSSSRSESPAPSQAPGSAQPQLDCGELGEVMMTAPVLLLC